MVETRDSEDMEEVETYRLIWTPPSLHLRDLPIIHRTTARGSQLQSICLVTVTLGPLVIQEEKKNNILQWTVAGLINYHCAYCQGWVLSPAAGAGIVPAAGVLVCYSHWCRG